MQGFLIVFAGRFLKDMKSNESNLNLVVWTANLLCLKASTCGNDSWHRAAC